MGSLGANYIEATALILFGIGLTTLLLHKNLIKKLIGFNIMETSIFLYLTAKGYIAGRGAPIIIDGANNIELYINPIPSGLVLTGIVIAVSITAFMLALCIKIYEYYGTLDMDKIILISNKDGSKTTVSPRKLEDIIQQDSDDNDVDNIDTGIAENPDDEKDPDGQKGDD